MKCQCPHFKGDGGCLAHRLTMTERQRGQCRSSPHFFDGFAYIGRPKIGPKAPQKEAGTPQPPRTPREPDKAPDDLPCIHRGEPLEIVKCKPCQSRGKAGAETWACAVHERCAMHNIAVQAGEPKVVACITCDDRSYGDASEASRVASE